MAANIFTGVTDSNWGTATNWSQGTVPTAIDTHVTTFDATSPNCTVDASDRFCNILNFNGYTNVITMTYSISVSGNITLDSTMASRVSGSGGLKVNTSATLTSNGGTWNNSFTFAGTSQTYVLADNWNILGTLLLSGSILTTINGLFSLNVSGGITLTGYTIGTASIVMNGTGTIITTGAVLAINLTINTAGTITISGNFNYGSGTLTYIAGTVVTTGSSLDAYFTGSFNCSGITWNNISFNGIAQTYTLLSDLNLTGTLATGGTTSLIINGSNINCGGSLLTTNSPIGTTNFIMNGTGSVTTTGSTISVNLTINTAGTITMVGTVNYSTGTLTYIAGTVVTTSSTLNITSSSVLNTNGINWNNVTISTGTINLNSLLTVNGTLAVGSSGTVTFAGTSGFTCGTFSCVTAGRTINYAVGKTYLVTNSLIITGTSVSRISFVSTSTGALFNLQVGASQSVTNCNATWINSSGGQTIYSNPSVLINTTNWSKSNGFITWFNSQF